MNSNNTTSVAAAFEMLIEESPNKTLKHAAS